MRIIEKERNLEGKQISGYDEDRMIFVNFKTYKQGTGEKAVELAKICQQVEKETSVKIIPVVQVTDIFRFFGSGIEVWTQHLDSIEYGQNTGQILPEAVLEAGAKGTLLNHSENKLPKEVIGETIKRCRELKIKVLVCAESIEEGKEIAEFKPDFIAYEPPEFIGSRMTSVASARPEIIKDFINLIPGIPILVGAGVHSREDIRVVCELGAAGVLVATDVVLAQNSKKELLDLAGGFDEKI